MEESELDKLLENTPCIEGELGHVFITQSWLPSDPEATITLDVQGFFGTKTIKASGLRKQSLY